MRDVLFVDNRDSFVYNIVELWRRFVNRSLTILSISETEGVDLRRFAGILLSPGPGLPSELPSLMRLIDDNCHLVVPRPLLGVCLGHQAIAEYFGARLRCLETPCHGMSSALAKVRSEGVMQHISEGETVGRYHSWVVDTERLPECLRPLAMSREDDQLMALQHCHLPLWGVQFHPESIITQGGERYLLNWARILAE